MTALLAWKNLWRNPRRTLITMASVSFAVLFAVVMESVQKGAFDHMVKNVVTFYYGYLQVHRQGYWNEQILDNSFENDSLVTKKISSTAGVRQVAPRIESFALASAGAVTKGCMVAGIEPMQEDKLTLLSEKISSGTYLQHNDNGALLAEGLAKRLGLATGDTLVLLGQGYQDVFAAGKFEVKGTVHFGSPELNDGMVYLALPAAQQWLNASGRLTSLALDLGDPSMLQQAQSSVSAAAGNQYEVMTWEEMMPQLSNHIKADSMSMYIFSGVLYMIVGFGIFGTVLMMTAERRFELGMLIAIGMKRGLLAKMLLIETVYISLLGVALGSLISLPAVLWLQSHPIRFTGQMAEVYQRFGFEAVLPATLSASIFLWQAIVVLILAVVAGLYPALHVRKINPASIRQ